MKNVKLLQLLVLLILLLQNGFVWAIGSQTDSIRIDSSRADSSQADSSRTRVLERIRRQVDSLSATPFLRHGTAGLCIKVVGTQQKIFDYNAQKSLSPASTMKLVATATALVTLGENYTYQTNLEYSGEIRDSVLQGNLWIRGSGDPSLGSARVSLDRAALIDRWIQKLKFIGIKRIEGSIVADGSYFDDNHTPDTWTWGNMGNYFGAGATGLNFNENSFRAVFRGNNLYETTTLLRTEPDLPFIQKMNQVTAAEAGTGDNVNIYSSPFQNLLVMQGTVPRGQDFGVRGSIPDPGLALAYALHKALNDNKLKVIGDYTSVAQLRAKGESFYRPVMNVLDIVASPTLRELAQKTNFHSINLYAEALFKTVAVTRGHGNTTEAGIKATESVWRQKGLKMNGLWIKDGSGLSPQNGITPENLTDILLLMNRENSFNAFYESIPQLGVAGTVANLGRGTAAAGNVRAKSGSINAVRAYAGYFRAKNGELMAFSFCFNQYDGNATRELEKLMVMMCEL
jgi:serine-type D-Ala-D-Ala carboxypeptidase/endopeptidase (penicillin-binding protein 4)